MSIALVIPGTGGRYSLSLLSLFLAVVVIQRYTSAIHLALCALLLFLTPRFGTSFHLWPVSILAPLIIYGLIVIIVPVLRNSTNWLKRGKTDSATIRLAVAASIISAIALIAWVVFMKPDIEHHIALMPELPFRIYPLAGAGFALSNAVMEEVVFRGIVVG